MLSTVLLEKQKPLVDGISSYTISRQKFQAGGFEISMLSETYYSAENVFVVTYLVPGAGERGLKTLSLGEAIPEGTKSMLLKDYRKMCENRVVLSEKYPLLDMGELERIQASDFIERMLHWCNKDEFIFPVEDANGVPLVPMAQRVEGDTITVTYHPAMDGDDVLLRLIDEEEYKSRQRFYATNGY